MDSERINIRPYSGKHLKSETKTNRTSIPFFVLFFTLSVISFIIPLRPVQSVREKRTLSEFPVFSVDSLLNGNYFNGITIWFSDTFPFREKLLDISSSINGMHGYGSIIINYDVASVLSDTSGVEGTNISSGSSEPVTPFENSEDEDFQFTDIVSGDSDTVDESDATTEGAFIDDGNAEIAFGKNIQIDDSAYGLFVFNQTNSDAHAEEVNVFADMAVENGITFYDMLVPSSLIKVSDSFSSQLGCSSVSEAFSYIYSHENGNVVKINIFDALAQHNDEYIYFHSDHHWTALGAYYAYLEICSSAGLTPIELSQFEEINMGEYQGSYYYNVPQTDKLATDELIAYKPISDLSMIVYGNDSTYSSRVLTDLSREDPTRKYYSFLGGDIPLAVITNNSIQDNSSCILIKDSFGSPLAVFLAEHFHTLYVVDYRVYYGYAIELATEHDVKMIILSQSIELVQNDKSPQYLNHLFRKR